MGAPANYEFVNKETTDAILVIKDVGPWDTYFTITNDAEGVVADLRFRGHLPEGRRLFWYDSEGELGELLIKDGQFAGFKYLDPVETGKLKGWMK